MRDAWGHAAVRAGRRRHGAALEPREHRRERRRAVTCGGRLLVPARDAYRAYFEAYRDDIEMKPLFIANLQSLQLMVEKTVEAQKYNAFISE